MSEYPRAETYAKLYQKYLTHRPASELVDLAGDVKGKNVWDLCCGAGEMAILCAERGAKFVRCVDASFFMTSPALWALEKLKADYKINSQTIEQFLWRRDVECPDVVLCRQAVNYWMNEAMVKMLAEKMPSGSVFVFNTFNRQPDSKPNVRQYELSTGKSDSTTYEVAFFVETSWYVQETNKVHHIQVRSGMEPHVTEFNWIHPDDFYFWLSPYFDISCKNEGGTALYRCVRR